MSNSNVKQLQKQLQRAWQFTLATVGKVTPEQLHWHHDKTHTLAGLIGHLLISEDLIINVMLGGGAPLFATAFANNTGLSELPPLPNAKGIPSRLEWSHSVQIDMSKTGPYAQAAHAATNAYLEKITDDDLSTDVGDQTVFELLNTILSNYQWYTGEIAVIKGLQGLTGYPI